jgi:hypothetical protein
MPRRLAPAAPLWYVMPLRFGFALLLAAALLLHGAGAAA